jgi:disulfide bond formation protein DsbB
MDDAEDWPCVLCGLLRYAAWGFIAGAGLAIAYMAADVLTDGALTKAWSSTKSLATVTDLTRRDDGAA